MNEYQQKITKLLDQAADELDADDFDELLDSLNDEILERQDGSDDEEFGDEDDG